MAGSRSVLRALFLGVLIAAAAPLPAEPSPLPGESGELCVDGQKPCLRWPSERERVAASSGGRPFVFAADGARTLLFGVVPADPATLDPAATARASAVARLRIVPARRRPPDAPVVVQLKRKDPEVSWAYPIAPRQVSALRELRMPAGAFELRVLAGGHLPLTQTFAVRDAAVDLGSLTLREAPVLTGRVIDRDTHEPLPAAVILSPDLQTLATPDATGSFSIAMTDETLRALRVEAPGRVPRTIPVEPSPGPRSLGDIELSEAGGAIVRLAFPDSAPEKVTVSIVDTSNPNESVVLTRRVVQPHETEARFEQLEPGQYAVVVEGDGALERFALPVEIEAAAVAEQTATIRPRAIVVKTMLGAKPLPAANVQVSHMGNRWRTDLRTDADGELSGALWQGGRLLAAVSTAAIPQPHIVIDDVDAAVQTWELVVPDRRIVGVVVDQKTARPIPDAHLQLRTRSGDSSLSFSATTREDGTFEFTAVRPGQQTLSVSANGYLRPQPVEFLVGSTDERVERLVELTAGRNQRLSVQTAQGVPIAGADVYAAAGAYVVSSASTDPMGVVDLAVPPDVPAVAYVFPREGSFAIARLPQSESAAAPTVVRVPPAQAGLHAEVKDPEGAPIPGVQFLMRYEGEFLPLLLVRQRRLLQPDGNPAPPRLPVGYYELWPVRTEQEALAIIAADGQSPVRLGLHVVPGMNRATLELKPRQ
ncbi:MAG TPA: carboxypeptidase regulatory-like domain-containing protein [Thermoanaerobaculia bacterium]